MLPLLCAGLFPDEGKPEGEGSMVSHALPAACPCPQVLQRGAQRAAIQPRQAYPTQQLHNIPNRSPGALLCVHPVWGNRHPGDRPPGPLPNPQLFLRKCLKIPHECLRALSPATNTRRLPSCPGHRAWLSADCKEPFPGPATPVRSLVLGSVRNNNFLKI